MTGKKTTKQTAARKPRTPKAKSSALTTTLRGADDLDEELVDQAVQRLNAVYQTKGLETARSVAECVIDVFFDGRPENFFARGKSHLSFAALKEREDLQVSYQFMWNSCAVYDQLRRLPADIAEALPLSHHKLLLPVKDEDKKRELAAAAVAGHMSKQRFADEVSRVRKELNADSKAGRPPLPAFVKAFGKMEQIVALAGREPVSEISFAHYPKEEAVQLLAKLDRHLDALTRVADQVRKIITA